jgi:hypothetical protein
MAKYQTEDFLNFIRQQNNDLIVALVVFVSVALMVLKIIKWMLGLCDLEARVLRLERQVI